MKRDRLKREEKKKEKRNKNRRKREIEMQVLEQQAVMLDHRPLITEAKRKDLKNQSVHNLVSHQINHLHHKIMVS